MIKFCAVQRPRLGIFSDSSQPGARSNVGCVSVAPTCVANGGAAPSFRAPGRPNFPFYGSAGCQRPGFACSVGSTNAADG
jgi:hypothetical protein